MQKPHPWGKVFDLLKITLRVPHIVSVKHFNTSTLSGLGAYFDFDLAYFDFDLIPLYILYTFFISISLIEFSR